MLQFTSNRNLPRTLPTPLERVPTFRTFQLKRLFLTRLGKLFLQRPPLASIPFLFPLVATSTYCQGSTLPRLIKADTMLRVSITFRTVRVDFFRNVHCDARAGLLLLGKT